MALWWPCGGFVWLESGSPSKGGTTGPEPRSRTLPWNLAVAALLWSAAAERSGAGALAHTGQRADGSKPGARFVCPRTLLRGLGRINNSLRLTLVGVFLPT